MTEDLYQKIITENSYQKMTKKKTGLVGIRVDINSPLDVEEIEGKKYKQVVKSPRMNVCAQTILKIVKMGYTPIIFAHQGRFTKKGPDANCIPLKSHADMLDGMLHNINVHFQDDPILSLTEYDGNRCGVIDSHVQESRKHTGGELRRPYVSRSHL